MENDWTEVELFYDESLDRLLRKCWRSSVPVPSLKFATQVWG